MLVSRQDVPFDKLLPNTYLKFDIQKYFQLLPGNDMQLIEPQTAIVNAINLPHYRFIVAALARRTGKTYIANIVAQLTLLIPGVEILIIAPNYNLAGISWDLQRKFLKLFNIELTKSNAKDRVMELANGSKIIMGSITQVDSVVGRSYRLIIFDEAALGESGRLGEDAFNIQLRPTLDQPDSKCIFISTPRGNNWFRKFYQRGFSTDFPRWVSVKSTWHDNPRASIEDIEDAKRSMSEAEFSQEYLCSFIALEGRIWNFKDSCVQPFTGDRGKMEVVAGLDIGFRDATAFIVLLTDGIRYYAVDEYVEAERTTFYHGQKIQTLMDKYEVDYAYIDHSAQQTKFDLVMDFDFTLMNAKKSILDGIGYVASLIEKDKLVVDPKCKNLIETLENYAWDDKILEKPVRNQYSHMADALRYAIYSYKENFELEYEEEDIPKEDD